MTHYAKPTDFEDMMRPIAKAALNQNWTITHTANGHFKFLPPKGPPIIVSGTNAAYKPNISKLREGGLKMPNDAPVIIISPNEDNTKAVVEVVKPLNGGTGGSFVPLPPPKPAPKLARGVMQNAVLDYMKSVGGGMVSMDDITKAVQAKIPGADRNTINTTCSQQAAIGKLVRMGKGVYRYVPQVEPAKPEQEMLPEDEEVLNNFMDALAKLQDWVAKMRKMSAHFNKMKKLLEGMKVE